MLTVRPGPHVGRYHVHTYTTIVLACFITLAGVFALVYHAVNDMVARKLAYQALSERSSSVERRALADAANRSVRLRATINEMTPIASRKAKPWWFDYVVLDDSATLDYYQERGIIYWIMNSALTQAGIGGEFAHVSDTQRVVVVMQVITVLSLTAYAIAYDITS